MKTLIAIIIMSFIGVTTLAMASGNMKQDSQHNHHSMAAGNMNSECMLQMKEHMNMMKAIMSEGNSAKRHQMLKEQMMKMHPGMDMKAMKMMMQERMKNMQEHMGLMKKMMVEMDESLMKDGEQAEHQH